MKRGLAVAVGSVLALCSLAPLTACGKTASKASASSSAEESDLEPAPDTAAPMEAREGAEWAAAGDAGDPEELMRLVDLVGCRGVRERAGQPALRATALQAMAYCPDFSELPWLARVAEEGSDGDARAALDAVDALAARPRRATDPGDAEELHAGCAALLGLARAEGKPRVRRLLAIRALRMLADRGCVRPEEIPALRRDGG